MLFGAVSKPPNTAMAWLTLFKKPKSGLSKNHKGPCVGPGFSLPTPRLFLSLQSGRLLFGDLLLKALGCVKKSDSHS